VWKIGDHTQSFNIRFLDIFEGLTPINDLRTKRKSKKPTISSENEIEKWHLWQSARTVQPFKRGKVRYTAYY